MRQPVTEAQRHQAKTRARQRLAALGVEVDAMDHEQLRAVWESSRAAYINIANAGLHMHPVHTTGDPLPGACAHARYGMLADAIADYFGEHPASWSAPQIDWPHHGDEQAPTITVVHDPPAHLRAIEPPRISTLN